MRTLINNIREQPFICYLRGKPLHTPATPGALADASMPPAPTAHLDGIETTWLAKRARQTASIASWMSAIRLVSNNTPLLSIPQGAAAQAVDMVAAFRKPTGLTLFAVKDAVCERLEAFAPSATYATRLARWSARGAASLWYVAAEGLSQADVRAWQSRPDYEYPVDCDPHDFSPTPDPHCPVLAVGQLAEKMEPVVGAVLIGAAGVTLGLRHIPSGQMAAQTSPRRRRDRRRTRATTCARRRQC